MPMRKRDIGFFAFVGVLLLVLTLSTFRDKPKRTPDNEHHRSFAAALGQGAKRETVEKGCVACHGVTGRKLPQQHPPKEQCLICHVLQSAH